MQNAIQLFVSDVDGTLIGSDKALSVETIEAVSLLHSAGIRMTLISARPPSGILPLARRLGLTLPLGAFNGGTIIKPDGEILAAHRIDQSVSRLAIGHILANDVDVWVYADQNWYVSDLFHPRIQRERESSMVDPIGTEDFEALHGRIDKIVAVSVNQDMVIRIDAELNELLANGAEVSRSNPIYCDITHPSANKGAGIAELAAAIGIPISRVAAIGDMPNDIGMLRHAALGIAMGQAPELVKEVADWVTASNVEHGVAQAITRILELSSQYQDTLIQSKR